jgi:N-acetylmuramoyl-L-alanine amidase CwlA
MSLTISKKTNTVHTQELKGRTISYIVIHYTAGVTSKAGTAANTASYYATTDRDVSADYTVDDSGAVLYNPDIKNRFTWHCGGTKYSNNGGSYYGKCTNKNSIGIEICSTNSTGKMQDANATTYSFTDKVVANAVELVKQLMKTYGINAAHVIRHYDVTGKLCPGIKGWNAESGSESAWNSFKTKIGATATTSTATKTTTTTTTSTSYKVKVTATALNVRAGAGTSYKITQVIRDKGTYTIVETSGNWGKLKSGAGWICLDYTKRV